jgi:hypothetical protein
VGSARRNSLSADERHLGKLIRWRKGSSSRIRDVVGCRFLFCNLPNAVIPTSARVAFLLGRWFWIVLFGEHP